MFEDITKAKKKLLKSSLGYDLTTVLDANAIAQKIVEKHQYNTSVKLEFNIIKEKFGKNSIVKIIMTHKGKDTEYIIGNKDILKFTHYFDVVL